MPSLGIETSCDDTAVGIVTSSRAILSDCIHLQSHLHEPKGGIVLTLAMVSHRKNLPTVIRDVVEEARVDVLRDVDIIAVTIGPGLGPCLGVGVDAAKSLACVLRKPIIGFHHMEAHALTLRLLNPLLSFPYLTLLISGGHTLMLLTRHVNSHTILSTTVGDSISEAFDKVTRLLNIPWLPGRSGGLALHSDAMLLLDKFQLQHLTGLKTAVKYLIEEEKLDVEDEEVRRDLAAVFQYVAVEHLIGTSNKLATEDDIELFFPPPELCADNGVMIAWAGIKLTVTFLNKIPKWPIDILR
ncbi:8542_t:CDS:2 [Paraglomus occultum]|uniref:N(6)-L-threonylcarbamoyladenine synthase n=1 Tax=Paraglomus occultum TaxID=144539 RepID=A0A9N9C1U5_9GLOM|nr:8542_t:CDS:2 [Paraglomus occultum]